jgi:hypothetical protein
MKTKNIVLSILMMFALVSCKNDTAKTETETAKTELKETFDVNFNLVVPKDDTFKLYYTEDGTLNFGDDRAVLCVVKGSSTPQDLLFKLPADVLPTQIRFDFGDNAEQGDIIVNSMKFKYLKNTYEKVFGAGEEITHYFYPLEAQIKIDNATKTVKLLKPKGQVHDPLMWSNQLLSDEMEKLYKN